MSKGNFLDFLEEISRNQSLCDEFLAELYKPGMTQEELLKFFLAKDYSGVSPDDAGKMLTTAAAGDIRIKCDFSVKY
ncbi:MAG: hypothetical protein V2B18_07240 [Pseudomonadota bacterium]